MLTARDLMRSPVVAVSPDTPAEEAIDQLVQHEVSGVPVIDSSGRIVGVFSEIDRIQWGSVEGRTVGELMTTKVVTVDVQASVVDIARTFKEHAVRRLPVTKHGTMVGIIGLRDLVRYIRDTELTLKGVAPIVRGCELFELERCGNVD